MKRLILMRHAKSSWAEPGQRDHDRPLNKRGRRSSTLLGDWLKARDLRPDCALVSSARRTQETWTRVVDRLGPSETHYVPEIYEADAATLLRVLRAAGAPRSVLLLGHQPGIGALAAELAAEKPASRDFEHYPTGATTVLDFAVDDWAAVTAGSGALTAFTVPRALE